MFRVQSRGGSGGTRRLWLGVAAAVAFLGAAAPAQAAPFVYVTDRGGDESVFDVGAVSQFDVGAGGLLAPLSPPSVASDGGASSVAVSPDGQSVYVTNPSSVSQYDVGPGGALTPKSPATVGGGGLALAVSPDGQSVYVTNFDDGVLQYDVGPGGELTPKSPPSVAAGDDPRGVAVSPDGSSVYVTNIGGQSISQYDVGPGGALQPKSPATVFSSSGPWGVAVSPNGQSVYVAHCGTVGVSQYDVGPGGELTPKSPATVAADDCPRQLAVSPDSQSVYVTNFNDGSADVGENVSQYDVGPGGELTPKSPPSVAAGNGPFGVAVSPDGRSVYIANSGNDPSDYPHAVSQYDVGPGGELQPKSPPTVATGFNPRGVAVSPATTRVPSTKRQCKHGGWKQFGFKNQGRCIRFVKRGSRN
jgi:DNA-binding beta-propeller fold protein YncE